MFQGGIVLCPYLHLLGIVEKSCKGRFDGSFTALSTILANVKLSLFGMFDKTQSLSKASPSDMGLSNKLGLMVSIPSVWKHYYSMG